MVNALQIASAAASFGPAVALLYFTLRDYTFPRVEKPYFVDSRLFKFFALGIVLGMVLFFFEAWSEVVTSAETLLAFILALAVMEELLKLVILNFPRFQRKVDTAFYGLAMGLGISATLAFAKVYSIALALEDEGSVDVEAFTLSGLLLSVQLVLLHGATTTFIGIGVVRGDLKGYFSEALLAHVMYSVLMVPAALSDDPFDAVGLAGVVAATALVAYEYAKAHRTSLPALVKDAKRLSKGKK